MENFENGQYKIGIEGRLSKLETKVEEIANNHLKHIDAKLDNYHKEAMDKYDKLVLWLLGTVTTAALSLLFQILSSIAKNR